MPVTVRLTDDAARDLEEIFDHVSRRDAPNRAERLLERMEETFQALSAFPERGSYPRELLDLGIREYREVFFKPYRIIYRVTEDGVYVMVVADGRRDMRALLQRRLLRV